MASVESQNIATKNIAMIKLLIFALPHSFLVILSIVYILVGAFIFRKIEGDNWAERRTANMLALERQKHRFVHNLYNMAQNGLNFTGIEGVEQFSRYVDSVYQMHQDGLLRRNELVLLRNGSNSTLTNPWTFSASVFFVVATLTTIGYGTLAPISRVGRLFCICFSIIGIPLLLITTADFAKFISSALTSIYVHYLQAKERLRKCLFKSDNNNNGSIIVDARDGESINDKQETEQMADYMWSQLEHVHEVKIGASVVLIIVMLYSLLGAYLMPLPERWSFSNALYFSFISCMKIGFGDVIPNTVAGLWMAMVYSIVGLTISTMCIDVVGGHYLERLHDFGRRMGTTDYLHHIKRAKFRRQKKEVLQKHYKSLVMLGQMNLGGSVWGGQRQQTRVENKAQATRPSPVENVTVMDITPYSMKLCWNSPTSPGPNAKYVVTYKIKHHKTQHSINIDDIDRTELEIKSLRSFSIYELEICCINTHGKGPSVKIVQITEPETAPQDLQTFATENEGEIRVHWKPPYKMKQSIDGYAIYYCDKPDTPFDGWSRMIVPNEQFLRRESAFDWTLAGLNVATRYAVCLCSVYSTGMHSPLSKAVLCDTV